MKSGKQRYASELKALFPIHTKKEKQYIRSLLANIEESRSYSDIIEEFGEPTSAVSAYYENIDTQQLIRSLKRKRLLQLFLGIVAAAIIVCAICYCISLREALDVVKSERITDTEVTITEEVITE